MINRNIPTDIYLLPELYKQFNLLSLYYLKKEYPECEWDSTDEQTKDKNIVGDNKNGYNDQCYTCSITLFAEGATNTEAIVIDIDNLFGYGIEILANTITEALIKVNKELEKFT